MDTRELTLMGEVNGYDIDRERIGAAIRYHVRPVRPTPSTPHLSGLTSLREAIRYAKQAPRGR